MATQQRTVDFILDQIRAAGGISARKMFGEYGLFCEGKMVALICDDQLFVKPTLARRSFLEETFEQPPVEQSPYPGAKPCLLIAGDCCEDHPWLTQLIRLTTAELPLPAKPVRT